MLTDNEMTFILTNLGNEKYARVRTGLRLLDSTEKRIAFERTQKSAGNELLKILDKMVDEAKKVV